jgi:imidazolonepropionase-like amidohydrolase
MKVLTALVALACPLACATGQQPPTPPVAIVNVNVLPMDREHVVAAQTVVIERGMITRMGPTRSTPVATGSDIIDGTGKYLIPGLADLHIHLHSSSETEQRHILQLFVVNGVTTVLNLRGTPQILELRAAVAEGRILGPTIYTAGPYVNEPFVTTPDEVERAVVDQRAAGYDFIKLHGSLSRESYARLNAAARREGIRVVGHAPRNLGVAAMFDERQYAVAHAEEFIYDTLNRSREPAEIESEIPALARRMKQTGIWLMPNLTAFKTIARMVRDLDEVLARPEMSVMPPRVREGWGPATNPYTTRMSKDAYPGIMALYEVVETLVHRFDAEGVRLLIGTDAMNTGVVPGYSAHDELADLVAAGLTPFEALQAATANAGAFLAKPVRRGVVAVGQQADLVLLDANPLEDVANSRRISGVLLRGRWLARSDLDRMLNDLRSPRE